MESKLIGKRKFIITLIGMFMLAGLLMLKALTGDQFVNSFLGLMLFFVSGSGLEYFSDKFKGRAGKEDLKPEVK